MLTFLQRIFTKRRAVEPQATCGFMIRDQLRWPPVSQVEETNNQTHSKAASYLKAPTWVLPSDKNTPR